MKLLPGISLFISLFVLSCGNGRSKNAPPKPASVPDQAFWSGGKDGGQWYLIDSLDSNAKTIHCKIYSDHNGEMIDNNLFRLHCYLTESKINWKHLEDEIDSYDGEYILLKTKDADEKSCYFR
jgi:hypothetical protein